MLTLFCVLTLFLGQALASLSANQYMDNVINTALQNVIKKEKLDPTHLSDFTFDYTDKKFGIKINGKAEYDEGSLEGLSKVQRFSNCEGPKNISSATVVNCTLVFQKLETSHKGKVKYGKLPKVSINAKGIAEFIYAKVGIVKPFNDKAQVKTFAFSTTGSMTTDFSGLGPVLNKHMKVLEENYKQVVSTEVLNIIQSRFQYALNLALPSVPMPLR